MWHDKRMLMIFLRQVTILTIFIANILVGWDVMNHRFDLAVSWLFFIQWKNIRFAYTAGAYLNVVILR